MNRKFFLINLIVIFIFSSGFFVLGNFFGSKSKKDLKFQTNDKLPNIESLVKPKIEPSSPLNSDNNHDLTIMYFKDNLLGIMYAYNDYFAGDGSVHIVNEKGDEIDTIVPDKDAKALNGYSVVRMSPNKHFVLVGYPLGDALQSKIYDINTKLIYDVSVQISGTMNFEWLSDNRLSIYEGCILADQCKKYESVSATKPWEFILIN